MFVHELGKRLRNAGHDTLAVCAHPGYTATPLQNTFYETLWGKLERIIVRPFLSQTVEVGALPSVMAATDRSQGAVPGAVYGPSGLFECKGLPVSTCERVAAGRDDEQTHKLWEISEELTGIKSSI